MNAKQRQFRRFSEIEMGVLRNTFKEDPLEGLVQMWTMILGKPPHELEEQISPGDYEVPYEQSELIFAAVPQHMRASFCMEWVNIGPIAVKEERECH